MFLISREDVYEEESSLNTSLYRAEQLSWTETDWSECKEFSGAKENFDAMVLDFSDSVMRLSPSIFKAGIARNFFLMILVKFQNDPWYWPVSI
jgi:hypothetical protein